MRVDADSVHPTCVGWRRLRPPRLDNGSRRARDLQAYASLDGIGGDVHATKPLEVTATTQHLFEEVSRVETIIGILGAAFVVLLAVAELLLPTGRLTHRPALQHLSRSRPPK